jgi:hypothetical protein
MTHRQTEKLIQSLLREADVTVTVKQLNVLVKGVYEVIKTKKK